MITFATSVPEASAEVSSLALTIPEGNETLTFKHQRFIAIMENDLVLTVWKIAPIKRSSIFALAGIIFTYTLMFYTLAPVERGQA
ncbi:hypothetical protein TNCT_396221 [Trichonephila clavata]|uniref:Uncharacterized protein n=1 Tax=Trichonephila clavata TaxID=2740835 RepID=A0A8X6GR59_TRICU|nr:hypothetical protein TNCT_396221 [Trichonephila clavata]